ncbi:MAG: AtpZ/AtpI family protein [Acidobacteriota bacterium]
MTHRSPDLSGTMADNKTQYQQIAEASALALMFPLTIGAGFLIGYGLDRLFGSWPWISFCGAGLGIVGAFINLFRTAAKADGGSAEVKSEDGNQ